MASRFDGKVAIVTGCGRAVAVRPASEGATVLVADLDQRPGSGKRSRNRL